MQQPNSLVSLCTKKKPTPTNPKKAYRKEFRVLKEAGQKEPRKTGGSFPEKKQNCNAANSSPVSRSIRKRLQGKTESVQTPAKCPQERFYL